MKLLKLSFILMLVLSLGACSNDDDSSNSCTQSDWVGTYMGTTDCITGSTEDVTVTITAVAGTETLTIKYETASGETEIGPFPFSNCEINNSFQLPNNAGEFAVTVELDGNNLSYTETITAGGASTTCTFTASK